MVLQLKMYSSLINIVIVVQFIRPISLFADLLISSQDCTSLHKLHKFVGRYVDKFISCTSLSAHKFISSQVAQVCQHISS